MKIVGILSVTTLRHADLLKTTMLKLQSRKQKQVDSSSHALSFLDSLNASRNESNAETKVAASTDDAVDRGVFFDRFHSETKGLMSLLTELKEAKAYVLNSVKGLERAKELSTLFIDGSIDLDSFVVRESFALLANTTIDESDQSRIHDEIVSIICQMKANHREVQQYVIDQLKIILSGADSSNIRGVFESLAQLRNVIVGQPINMLAVRELNTNISKALAGAISLCASKEIRSMQSSSATKVEDSTAGGSTSRTPAQLGASNPQPSSTEKLSYSSEEVQHIVSQNETMRNTIAQLRQRLAQNKAFGPGGDAPTRRSSVAGRREAKPKASSATSGPDRGENNAAVSEGLSSSAETQNDDYSSQSLVSEAISKHLTDSSLSAVKNMLEAHPLFPRMDANDQAAVSAIVDAVLSLIWSDILPFISAITDDLLRSDQEFMQEVAAANSRLDHSSFWEKASVIQALTHRVAQVWQLHAVQEEIFSLASLYLSYVHCMYELEVDLDREKWSSPVSPSKAFELNIPPVEPAADHGTAPKELRGSHFRTRSAPTSTANAHAMNISQDSHLFDPSSSLLTRSQSAQVPRYMQASKSFASKVRPGKSPMKPV